MMKKKPNSLSQVYILLCDEREGATSSALLPPPFEPSNRIETGDIPTITTEITT